MQVMKQHTIIVAVVVVATVALAGAGLYHYQHTNKGISLQTALVQRDAARAAKAVSDEKLANLKQVTDYTASQNKAVIDSVCTSLKTTKVTNPSCK
ncbi:hypothetical protein UFOVP253_23 [uncultured Caudovirales phage]|uniref:Uncharacterized protein n=1 Tax=uncultured Caudovirales phage TaxID=2100421 RepID=A0A6J5LH32_9CAUD|nr:hypothetical protein UFOVP253_23 [uncultured Caudovirales phage]